MRRIGSCSWYRMRNRFRRRKNETRGHHHRGGDCLQLADDAIAGLLLLSPWLNLDPAAPATSVQMAAAAGPDRSSSDYGSSSSSSVDLFVDDVSSQAALGALYHQNRVDPSDPLVSPITSLRHSMHLHGVPIHLQAGGAEVLLSDIRMFHTSAIEQGLDVDLQTYPNMVHVFQAFGAASGDCWQSSSRDMREFCKSALSGESAERDNR